MQGTKQTQGFTLVELMIVVALIGVLTSIAIPGFQRYQMNSKRAEAYTNLLALAKSQKSYYSEWNQYVAVLPEPSNTLGVDPGLSEAFGGSFGGRFCAARLGTHRRGLFRLRHLRRGRLGVVRV